MNQADRRQPPAPTTHISVLCVDDNADVANMLSTLIDMEPDMRTAGTLQDADGLMTELENSRPDVVLLDLTMPGRDPLDAMQEASGKFAETRFIVVSGHDEPERVQSALDRGAWGYVAKLGDSKQILEAIRTVARGEMYLSVTRLP